MNRLPPASRVKSIRRLNRTRKIEVPYMKKTITWFDQMPFKLACGHSVVLGRLDKADTWPCQECGNTTDLRVEPYRKSLERDRDTAEQIDKQARQRGETVVRADPNDPPRPL